MSARFAKSWQTVGRKIFKPLSEFVFEKSKNLGEKRLVLNDPQSLSYPALFEKVKRLSAFLQSLKLPRQSMLPILGDKVSMRQRHAFR